MRTLLQTLYGYHAWANIDLFGKLDGLDRETRGKELQAILDLIGHYYVVSRIFAGHLQGVPHGFASDTLAQTPALEDLRTAVLASDRWYLDYLGAISPEALSVPLAFAFTDGDKGFMTRAEMLIHVALHAGYHRGEAGRLLRQLSVIPPWDTVAVYLHQTDPSRRRQGKVGLA